jgi:hypothetical protein
MHWTDWLLTLVGGAVMLLMLVWAGCAIEWLMAMMAAIAAR